jgi:hypothetical protein
MNKKSVSAPILHSASNVLRVVGSTEPHKAGAVGNVVPPAISTGYTERNSCEPDQGKINLITKLRLLFQESLLKPRSNWDATCTRVAVDPSATLGDYATAFFHGLELHGARRFQALVSQSVATSFDESWLVQIVRQLQAGNIENAHYLVATRVQHPGRRRLLFLAEGLAAGLNRS